MLHECSLRRFDEYQKDHEIMSRKGNAVAKIVH